MSKTWLIGLVVILLGGGAILWSQYGEKEAPTPVVTSPAPAPTPAPTATTPAPEPTLEERADAAAKAAKAEADRLAAQAEVAAKAAADAAQAEADRLAAAAEKAARDAATAAERETARLAAEAEQAAKGAAAAAEREAARLATEAEQAAKAAKAAAGTLSEQAGQAARDAGQAIQGGARAIADEAAKAAKDAADAASRAIDGAPSAPVTPAPAPSPALAPVAPAEKDAMRAPDGSEKDAARAAAESPTPSAPGGSGPAGTGAAGPLAAVDPIPQAAEDAAGKRDSIDGDARQSPGQSPGQAPAAPDRDRPRFDVAQVDPAGGAVIAGSARPGARVQVKDQAGAVLGEGASDPSGAFAIVVDKPLPEGDSALTLEATDSDGTMRASEETVVVSRNGAGAPALVVAQADDAGRPARVLQQPKPDAGQTAAGGAGAGDKTAAGAPSSERIKTRDDALSVSSIDYDEKGSLSIAGEAQPGAEVTVDVDGKEVAQATAGADGAWQASAPPGSLPRDGVGRIGAQSGQAGQGQGGSALRVLRVVLPFAPAGLIQDFPRGRMVVVQPGNSLWRIARRTYGAGIRYSIIYAANRDQIRDADLIYPGQIFHAPTPREG